MRQDTAPAMSSPIVPEVQSSDDDDVVVALETARVSEERRDLDAAVRWLQRAASAARKQGRPDRAGVLSRAAAELAGKAERFERRPDEAQTFGALAEDDFSDSTIVDSAANIAAMTDSRELPVEEQPSSDDSADRSRAKEQVQLSGPTPVAPLLQRPDAPLNEAMRVAIKRRLGGSFEARPFQTGDKLAPGEQEALLVPMTSDAEI